MSLNNQSMHVWMLVELHIEQDMEGKRTCPKNACLRAFRMYWPLQNLMRQVFCEKVMVEFFQKFVESSESILASNVYFLILEIWFSISSKVVAKV